MSLSSFIHAALLLLLPGSESLFSDLMFRVVAPLLVPPRSKALHLLGVFWSVAPIVPASFSGDLSVHVSLPSSLRSTFCIIASIRRYILLCRIVSSP